jgi:CRISPR/Cas system-associated exonuclease Cas4 (RecB family)
MEETGTFSRGYIYHKAAEGIKDIDLGEFDEIIFAGFFYMGKAVMEVVRALYSKGRTTLVFQGDQKEWKSLEKAAETLGIKISPPPRGREAPGVSMYAVFDTHSAACMARDILKGIKEKNKTVIVLPDPANMLPVVAELGENFGDFNVSLGYPLKRGALCSLLELVMRAELSRKDKKYYSKDYLAALGHPLAKNLELGVKAAHTRILVHKVEEAILGRTETAASGSIFVGLDEIEKEDKIFASCAETLKGMGEEIDGGKIREALKDLHDKIFRIWEGIGSFSSLNQALSVFLDAAVSSSAIDKYKINLRVADRLYDMNEELGAVSFGHEKFETSEIFRIFAGLIEHEMIAFSGTPVKGFQVLGLFETRALNFDNVIILDANEGKLPHVSLNHPLIPNEVLRGLGVDEISKEEEIQRYIFKRLTGAAKEVHIIYEKETGKEKSRFVEEMVWQKEKAAGKIGCVPEKQASFLVNVEPRSLSVAKTAGVVESLKSGRYSASSVDTYLKCPLQFYFRYVLGLREKKELSDDLESNEIGTFIHEILEAAYGKFIGSRPVIDDEFIRELLARMHVKFDSEFKKRMKAESFLLEQVLEFRLKHFLDRDSGRKVEKILYLEGSFTRDLELSSGTFAFKYVVDRVDKMEDGSILILDYKTGRVDDKKPKNTASLCKMGMTRESIKENVRSFQLPLYYFFESAKYPGVPIDAALYSIRKPEGLKYLAQSKGVDIGRTMELCMKALGALMGEIIDPAAPFTPDKGRNCEYCPYKLMCR